MPGRVLIVAGEPSGDTQAAHLARAMFTADPDVRIYGVGGPMLREAGVDVRVDISELSIMGFSELAGGFSRVLRHLRALKRELRGPERPDLLILVDFPDFNLRLAKAAHRAGVPVFYYIGPQVWAWRTGRIANICRWVDRMVVLFPFEEKLYRERGLDAHFVGHPLAAEVAADLSPARTKEKYGLSTERPLVALLPGSRRAEVDAVLPIALEAAALIGDQAQFAIAKAPGLDLSLFEGHLRSAGCSVCIVDDDTNNLLHAADVALVTSGTATVECAILETPMVVIYRMSRFSYWLAKLLVRVDFIAMPNIVLERRVVAELIQDDASAGAVARELRLLLDDGARAQSMRAQLAQLRGILVKPGAAQAAAKLALEMLA